MNNQDKAAKALYGATTLGPSVCQDLAGLLHNFGLITPDLPKPQEHGGKLVWPLAAPDGWNVTRTGDYIRLSDERGAIITVNRKLARDLGHIFLASANHAEGHQE